MGGRGLGGLRCGLDRRTRLGRGDKPIRPGQFDARRLGGRLVLREDGVDADQPS
jgi:hypothetical protein